MAALWSVEEVPFIVSQGVDPARPVWNDPACK